MTGQDIKRVKKWEYSLPFSQDPHFLAIIVYELLFIYITLKSRNLSAIKGEVIPIIVKKQFSSIKGKKENEDLEKNKLIDFVEQEKSYGLNPSSRLYSCYAYVTELPCFRVNNVPAFWHCNNILR